MTIQRGNSKRFFTHLWNLALTSILCIGTKSIHFKLNVMLNPKLSILSNQWLDLVFDGRNKLYGAYTIRRNARKDLSKALFIGIAMFLSIVLVPVVLQQMNHDSPTASIANQTSLVFQDIPLQQKVEEELPTLPASKARSPIDQVKMTAPKVVPHELATDEPPTVDDLVKATPGPATITGDPSAPIAIDVATSEVGEMENVTEGAGEGSVFVGVEVSPTFPGGMKAFLNYVAKNYQYPSAAKEQGIKGQIILSFIVEKDGSLTDINVLRDIGLGTGEEAVRLLLKSPKWKPGIQNGRPVRVRYQLPIALQIQ